MASVASSRFRGIDTHVNLAVLFVLISRLSGIGQALSGDV